MKKINQLFPIIILLATLAIFNFVIIILTTQQAALPMRIGIATLSLILIYGIIRMRSWAFYMGITLMSFGIINSIWSIIVSIRLELPLMFGITMLMLFGVTLYYLIIKRNLFIK